MDEQNNFHAYQLNLEDNIELRKLVAKLEDLLEKKQYEIDNTVKLHNDLKLMHEKSRKECGDLNQKLIQTYQEKSNNEKKYEAEIQRLRSYFDKQKEVYEAQIIKLSSYDSETLKNKVASEVELKYRHVIATKDREIESLQNEIYELKKKNELIAVEYETFKNEATREIENIRENQKGELRDMQYRIQLLNEKYESNVDKESYKNMRQEVDAYRRQFADLQNEIANLRKEKDSIMIEKNEIKLQLMKELDQEKLKTRTVHNETERNSQVIKNLENEVQSLKHKLEMKTEELNELMEEKVSFLKELRSKENEYETFKAEIRVLRQKVEERDREVEENMKLSHEKEKQRFLQEKMEKEEYQKKIEELSNSLRDIQINFKNYHEKSNEELHCAKRDFYIIQEEKRMLIKRVTELQNDLEYIREDYEKKCKSISYYEREYNSLDDKYRELAAREAESHRLRVAYENQINEKNKEIEHLNSYLTSMKLDNATIAEKIKSEYVSKLDDLLKKKKYYKRQCVIFNQNLANMMKKARMNKGDLNINLDNDLYKFSPNENVLQSEESIHMD